MKKHMIAAVALATLTSAPVFAATGVATISDQAATYSTSTNITAKSTTTVMDRYSNPTPVVRNLIITGRNTANTELAYINIPGTQEAAVCLTAIESTVTEPSYKIGGGTAASEGMIAANGADYTTGTQCAEAGSAFGVYVTGAADQEPGAKTTTAQFTIYHN